MLKFSEFPDLALSFHDFTPQFYNLFVHLCSPPAMAKNLNYQHYWQYAMFFAIHNKSLESLHQLRK
jgi:hypothetical protein